MNYKILVADDELAIADIIKYNLKKEGYEVDLAEDGQVALELLDKSDYNLVILDIMMPNIDGLEVLRTIRKTRSIPVIMLTARSEEVDKILGLELGADDYVVKPFSMRELMARVKALLRRSEMAQNEEQKLIEAKDLSIDLIKYAVYKNGKKLDLTLREFELLKFLAKSPGVVFSREELLEKVWDYDYFGDIRTVDVTVRRLREKIEKNSEFEYILTKRGVGYYFSEN